MLTGSWVVLLSISWNNEGWSNSSTGEMMRSQPCTLSLRPSSTSQPLFSQWQTVVSILPCRLQVITALPPAVTVLLSSMELN